MERKRTVRFGQQIANRILHCQPEAPIPLAGFCPDRNGQRTNSRFGQLPSCIRVCDQRLKELNSRPSYLNPLWYAGSFGIGLVAGLLGDRWSLGFVAETERQVVAHLESHLEYLPKTDARSRAILEQMKEDEAEHASMATHSGAAELPLSVRKIMTLCSRIMTTTAYWI